MNEHIKEIGEEVHLEIPTEVVNVFNAEGKNESLMEDAS